MSDTGKSLALLCCPFCGGPAEFVEHSMEDTRFYFVECASTLGECAVNPLSSPYTDKEIAAFAWNNRAAI